MNIPIWIIMAVIFAFLVLVCIAMYLDEKVFQLENYIERLQKWEQD